MSTVTLSQIERLIDQLSPLEQVRLLEYLMPRIRNTVASLQPPSATSEEGLTDEWNMLFCIGDNIANLPVYGDETMTQSVASMRR